MGKQKPEKPKDEKRTFMLRVRMNDEEIEILKEKAAALNISMSEAARRSIMNSTIYDIS